MNLIWMIRLEANLITIGISDKITYRIISLAFDSLLLDGNGQHGRCDRAPQDGMLVLDAS